MPQFFTGQRIKASIERLAASRGKPSLIDFLVVKRTLAIEGTNTAVMAQGKASFARAVKELASIAPPEEMDFVASYPFFVVFAVNTNTRGFRSPKWISNGTNSTIANPPWADVLDVKGPPRSASLRDGHADRLPKLVLRAEGSGLPKLEDLAVWIYRHEDIESIFGALSNSEARAKALVAQLMLDYGLSGDEVEAVFDPAGLGIEDADLASQKASPCSYITGLAVAEGASANTGQTCSLDLVVALAAKPFVILTGTSGTGKSRSALKLAEQLQVMYGDQAKAQIFMLVAIGPDWTSPKKLIGFRTPFGQTRTRPGGGETNESYEITDAVRLILRASHPDSVNIPHFLVFDEMNLSHVERYFAPFLSLMEASNILEDGGSAPIVDKQSVAVISELLAIENAESIEAKSAKSLVDTGQPLKLPPNLFYVGTVNIDETTYMFSPKVLDRAHVLEVKAMMPSQYVLGTQGVPTIDTAKASQLLRDAIETREAPESGFADPSAILDLLASNHEVDASSLTEAKRMTLRTLDGCFALLGPVGFEFGFRVVQEVYGFMHVWTKAQLVMGKTPAQAMAEWADGLDRAIFQKVLPKIHGNRSALGDSLKALAAFLDGKHSGSAQPAKYSIGAERVVQIEEGEQIEFGGEGRMVRCQAKLLDMQARLVSRNYVSFVR